VASQRHNADSNTRSVVVALTVPNSGTATRGAVIEGSCPMSAKLPMSRTRAAVPFAKRWKAGVLRGAEELAMKRAWGILQ
jgi:hypothetical protein